MRRPNLFQCAVEIRKAIAANKCAVKKAVLQRRPGLDRNAVPAAKVKRAPVAVNGRFVGHVDVDAR